MRNRWATLTSLIVLIVSLIFGGDVAMAAESGQVTASEGAGPLVLARLSGVEARWSEVEAIPGLADFFASMAEHFALDPSLIPHGIGSDVLLAGMPGEHGRLFSLGLLRDAATLSDPRFDLTQWPWHLERVPLVRLRVDIPGLRRWLRSWASERPMTSPGVLAWLGALDLEGIGSIYATRDIVDGRVLFEALIVRASAAPGQRFDHLFARRAEGMRWSFAGELATVALALGRQLAGVKGDTLGPVESVARLFKGIDSVVLELRYDDQAIAISGELRFEKTTPNRP